jgi:hypothetical protein
MRRKNKKKIPDHVGGVELIARLTHQPRRQAVEAARPHVPHVVDEILHHLDAIAAVAEADSLDSVAARVAARLRRASIKLPPLQQVLLDGRLLDLLAANLERAAGW